MRNSLEANSLQSDDVSKRERPMPHEATASALTLQIDHAIDRAGDVTIVRCHGQLVFGVTDILSTQVRKLIPTTKRIMLDLSDLTFMDSMGLGTLVRLYVSAKSAGCEIQLTHLRKRIEELLALTNLLSVFSIIGEHGIKF
jgi:anti-sigma B factor antagonist